jgi:peptide/nickel transport system permease protein
MKLARFVVRRLILLIPVLLGILLISFTLSRVIPADPVRLAAGRAANEEMVESLRSKFGLDKPLPEQFVRYVVSAAQGDLGLSLTTRREVTEDVKRYYPATLELVLVAITIALVIGIPIGVVSARFENRWPDFLSRLLAFALVSVPGFWLALLLQLLAAHVLQALPISGRFDIDAIPPETITGLLLVDSLLHLDWISFRIALRHIILPASALSVGALATMARISRAAMIEALRKDFVLTARASGVPESIILVRHALRHALVPVLSMTGLFFTWLMAGSVLIETIFSWPGMGHYVVEASLMLDYNPLMGTMLVFGMTCGVVNILTDVGYAIVDPRIQMGFTRES